MTVYPETELLRKYSVDEPETLVIERDGQTVRVWLSFGIQVPPDAMSVWAGSVPMSIYVEHRGDVEKAYPGTFALGIRFKIPLTACLFEIRDDTIPLLFKAFDRPVLVLSMGVAPFLVTREIGRLWE